MIVLFSWLFDLEQQSCLGLFVDRIAISSSTLLLVVPFKRLLTSGLPLLLLLLICVLLDLQWHVELLI